MTLKVGSRAIYATMRHLRELASEHGCNIRYLQKKKRFELFRVDDEGNQVGDDLWLLETGTGESIEQVRSILLNDWRTVISKGAEFLKKESQS